MKQSAKWDTPALGALALVLAVLIGVFGIGAAKLRGAVKAPATYYSENIKADMDKRIADADTLVKQGQQVLDKNEATLTSAEDALAAIQKAKTPGAIFEANTSLTVSIGQLYEMLRQNVNSDKGSVLQDTWSDFLSREYIIELNYLSEYNALADKAQAKLDKFPASLIAKLAGVRV